MFYGGFGTNWREAKQVALKAALLSTVGVFLTAGLVALFCYFALRFSAQESFLIGAVISSTDAASVFSIMRGKRLGLKEGTASMLELESGSNDPSSYMLTVVALLLMGGQAEPGAVAAMVLAQYGLGILCGIAVAGGALFVLKQMRCSAPGFGMAFVIGVALLAFALPSLVGGNGYLSAYLAGIILGNSRIYDKKSLVHFFDGVTGLMQILIFFLLGLLATPSQLLPLLLPAVLIALFLTFVARPAAVFALLCGFGCSVRQRMLVSFAGLRGAASIVFAIMAAVHPAYLSSRAFGIVFCIVLLSILFQGSLIPAVARKLNMVDADADVLKTFTDYTEEVDLHFIKLRITDGHPWVNQSLRALRLPPESLVVLVIRAGQKLIPSGKTVLRAGDIAIMSAPAYRDDLALALMEQPIADNSEWVGKPISAFSPNPGELVVMILRGTKTLIPKGDTLIQGRDILVILSRENIPDGDESLPVVAMQAEEGSEPDDAATVESAMAEDDLTGDELQAEEKFGDLLEEAFLEAKSESQSHTGEPE